MELLLRKEAPADNFLLLRRRQRFGRGENISFRPPPAFFFAERLFLLSSRSADVTRHLQKEREEEKEEEEEGDSPKNEMCHLGTHCSPRLHKLNYFYAGMHVCTSDCKLAPAAPYRLGKMHTTFFYSEAQEKRKKSSSVLFGRSIFSHKKGGKGSICREKKGRNERVILHKRNSILGSSSLRGAVQTDPRGGKPFFSCHDAAVFRTGGEAPGFIHPFPPLRFHSHFLTTTFYSSSSFFSPFFCFFFQHLLPHQRRLTKKLGERAEELLRREEVAQEKRNVKLPFSRHFLPCILFLLTWFPFFSPANALSGLRHETLQLAAAFSF